MPAEQFNPVTQTEQGCYHCGQPVPAGLHLQVEIDGVARAMCCAGCEAVARTIVDNGLTTYYRQRSALPLRDEAVPDVVREVAAYDLPELENTVARRIDGHTREAALMLEGITCAACIWLIEQRVGRLPGVVSIDCNYAARRARVCWNDKLTRLSAILGAVTALGYRALPYDSARAEQSRRRERDSALWRLFVAGFGMMQVMMYLVPIYLTNGEMTADVERLMRIASLVLTLPVVLYAAAPFFRNAWRDLRTLSPGMDVPVALGIGAAFIASVAATITGNGEVYFDSVTMFVFLLLAARYLEMTLRQRALAMQEELARPAPATAERFTSWPHAETALVPAAGLAAGDYVRIRAGTNVPADGTVVAGESEVDERLLTGESRAQVKRTGDTLIGGTSNLAGALVMQVTRAGSETMLAGILRLLDRAVSERPAIARSADRVAQHFVTGLLVLAVIVGALWCQVDPQRAFLITVAVLVVSCPCALSLATPAAIAAATGALHARGVLVTRGDAIENLARATDFVFDKTGTLTTGEMRLAAVIPLAPTVCDAQSCLDMALTLETGSNHPIARALAAAAGSATERTHTQVITVPGGGVEARIDGRRVRFGSISFVGELAPQLPAEEIARVSHDVTLVGLADEKGWLALFTFADPLREHARRVVSGLAVLGKTVHLVSGDRPEIVSHIAAKLGIAAATGGATPDSKLAYVQKLQARGAVVAMIGDGVNDAAALGASNVAIAMGGGAEVTCGNADIVLLANRLEMLRDAVTGARDTLRIIRQNLTWAFGYNFVAIPLAAIGLVSPLLAGVGMAASSTLVVANAMRLLRRRSLQPGVRAPELAAVM